MNQIEKHLLCKHKGRTISGAVLLGVLLFLTHYNSAGSTNEEEHFPREETIKVTSANIRERPTTSSAIIAKMVLGGKVSLLSREGEWYIVRFWDSRVGWAHQSLFLEPEKGMTGEIKGPKRLLDIRTHSTAEGEEKVTFRLNGVYPPETFVIEGDRPRVVCDFFNTRFGLNIRPLMEVNGSCILQIRIAAHHGGKEKIRVVLDLVPDQDYEIKQLFFEKENIYALSVALKNPK